MRRTLALALLASSASMSMAQSCISLSGSTTCPAFNASSISTDATLVGFYPFLSFVSDLADFDSQLSQYVSQGYVQFKYQNLLGCDTVDLSNTTDYYARYTTTFLCNGIVQNSRQICGLSAEDATPMCANSCADQATSEQTIVSNSQLCANPNSDYLDLIRSDFTNCALPAQSLSGACIAGEENEPDECGFNTNLQGLCDYCRSSTANSTDSCCVGSNATGRCKDVTLPAFSSIAPLFTSTSTSSGGQSATGTNASGTSGSGTATAAASTHHGLSRRQIAGIVVGSVLGFFLLLALLALGFILLRRRGNKSTADTVLNQPSPKRGVQSMQFAPAPSSQPGYEVLPGGRVARMSALQNSSSESPEQGGDVGGLPPGHFEESESDPYGDSPDSDEKTRGPSIEKRDASLSGESILPTMDDSSPQSGSGDQHSSPEGMASGQSEQLPFFKDYYSADDIHPNDKVAVLWAYQPRAGDEFELERGDMLKVVGIWDDGWATGVKSNDRAEDYDGKHKMQRDSGVSNGSADRPLSATPAGEIKAFPLVCVCLPEAWKKTVEGDASTESGSAGPPGT